MKAREIVAWNLRALRTERGLSQEALADESEINRSFVSDIERATVAISIDMLERLAIALDVELSALVTPPATDAPPPPPLRSGRKRRR